MIRRIEFTLNLDDPGDAAIYEALVRLLRHRRAGSTIRQALSTFLFAERHTTSTAQRTTTLAQERSDEGGLFQEQQVDATTAAKIMDQSATMFGF